MNKLRLIIIMLFFTFIRGNCVWASIDGDSFLLKLVIDNIKENIERVPAWKGKAERSDYHKRKDGSALSTKGQMEFYYDRNRQGRLWKCEINEYLAGNPEKMERNSTYETSTSAMFVDSKSYRFDICSYDDKGQALKGIYIKPIETSRVEPYSYDLDPYWYLSATGKLEYLETRYAGRNNERSVPARIQRNGQKIILRSDHGEQWSEYQFDAELGYNLVAYSDSHGVKTQLSYLNQGGAWVPAVFEREYETDKEVYRLKIIFKESEVIDVIPGNVFTTDFLSGDERITMILDQSLGIKINKSDIPLSGDLNFELSHAQINTPSELPEQTIDPARGFVNEQPDLQEEREAKSSNSPDIVFRNKSKKMVFIYLLTALISVGILLVFSLWRKRRKIMQALK